PEAQAQITERTNRLLIAAFPVNARRKCAHDVALAREQTGRTVFDRLPSIRLVHLPGGTDFEVEVDLRHNRDFGHEPIGGHDPARSRLGRFVHLHSVVARHPLSDFERGSLHGATVAGDDLLLKARRANVGDHRLTPSNPVAEMISTDAPSPSARTAGSSGYSAGRGSRTTLRR